MNLSIAGDDHNQYRNHLAQKLDAVVEIEAVVRDAECRQHPRREHKPAIVRFERDDDYRGDQNANDHRKAADTRNRDGVDLANARFVDDAPFRGHPAEYGKPRHGDDHRQQKGHDVQHSNSSWARSAPEPARCGRP